MINNTTKTLEYLSLHDSGDYEDLKKKISEDQLQLVKRSDVLIVEKRKYKFTEKGKEIYATEYASEEKSFWGL